MATKLDQIKKKYGYTGKSYRELMSIVIAENTQTIREKIYQSTSGVFDKFLKKVRPEGKRIIIPTLQDVVPTQEIAIRKAAERGKLLTSTLRDKLSADLQSMFEILTPATKEQRIIRRRGTLAGTMNPDMIRIFKEKITESFESYMKVDPKFGVPSNIHQIAVTELRGAINPMKDLFVGRLINDNPDLAVMKKWVHNPHLSKHPREIHAALGRRPPIPYSESFVFTGQNGGTVSMKYPHDPDAPAEEVIGCNCELEYTAKNIPSGTVRKDQLVNHLRVLKSIVEKRNVNK